MRGRIATIALVLVGSPPARAGKQPRFEPTDLELEDSGTAELDLQLGLVKGPDASRIVMPDFELDLGILPNVELGLDGAYAIEGAPQGASGPRLLDHSAPDNLWASVKLGLWDRRDAATGDTWAIGLQLGPKLPVATTARGVGVEGLVLVGRMLGRAHLVGQIGGLVDPHPGTSARPFGVEGGLDLELELDRRETWALLGELGGIGFGSTGASQVSATVGLQWSPSPKLDVSVVALAGFFDGSDPAGILFGLSPKLSLW